MPEQKELRDILMDAIERVKDGQLDPDRAMAVAKLSEAVINADQFQLNAVTFMAKHGKVGRLSTKMPLAITHEAEIDEETDEKDELEEEEVEEPPAEPETIQVLDEDEEIDLDELAKIVEEEQPIKLAELSARTGVSQRDLFAALKDERFEASTHGYWMTATE